MASFRVLSAFAAVKHTHRETFVVVPEGAIIETSDGLEEPGFVRITLGEETLLAFTRDLQERAECLDGSNAT